MTVAIISILATVVSFTFWLLRRKIAATPQERLPATYERIDKAIAQGNARAVNTELDDVLKRLRAAEGNSGGQGSNSTKHE